ncbi:hypothetical protein ACG33_12430 [Steroidobacter denitrificans]|uniref:Uncharacterized protein n=1 Tax=Steroidobacter denitrificans TaxID=465721 RepID=A0A127FDX3_STEDE|nr:hypothetical protein ACG33_00395 [Steroidobacter denitrificans]AMN47888.1 hypothetical protein ACG33_12430 [Steroidobacter denitrificans]
MLKAGTRVKCAVCDTEVMVVRSPAEEVVLSCGGVEMVAMDAPKRVGEHVAAEAGEMALVGKRYVDAGDTLELLCTKAGKGALGLGGEALTVKQAKPLPSSD